MCGVCGFTFPAPQAESRSRDLEAMLASMSHRGPDGQGTFVSCGVALGHRRLAIIDLRSGDQPMTGPSGCTIVFNGEIYNYRELRTELESGGRAFATTSDTEVLLAAYEEWDHAFLDHRLVELVAMLPDKAKMSGLSQKVVLKRAMAERLPRSILARAKKGFNFPAYCISSQSLEPPAGPGIFRKGFRLSPQREDVTYKSFNLLILGIWYEMYERFRVTNRWEPLS